VIEPHIPDVARVIQLVVAPVFMLTAVGTIISVLNTRLGRIVDRIRVLEQRKAADSSGHAATDVDLEELPVLSRRIRLTYYAILLAIACALLVCLMISTAFFGAFVSVDLSRLVGGLFVAAMFALIGGLLVLLREVFLAVSASRHTSH